VSFLRTSLAHLVFHFYLTKEYPSEMIIVINNNKTVFVTTNTNIGDRTKQVNV
jgi:hypothetical protein